MIMYTAIKAYGQGLGIPFLTLYRKMAGIRHA